MSTNLISGKVNFDDSTAIVGSSGNLYKNSVDSGNKIPIQSEIETSVTTSTATASTVNADNVNVKTVSVEYGVFPKSDNTAFLGSSANKFKEIHGTKVYGAVFN